MDTKVMVAMSGGVDSTTAAWQLLQQGTSCVGAYMHLCGDRSEDAAAVAQKLGLPFYQYDCRDLFSERVMADFVRVYEGGGTPNPCIVCNNTLKFGYLLQKALELGCTHIATGHYARIQKLGDRYLLRRGACENKDQSYFLAGLTPFQLAHTLFPLGELRKDQVRDIAARQGFINARKKDSQDICFVPDGDYAAFIRGFTGKTYPTGSFLDLNGKAVGTHQGAICYTLGQRKGLGLAMGEPVYVCRKDMAANTVTVGPNEALFATSLLADRWNWIALEHPTQPLRCAAKARSRHKEQPATAYPEADGIYRVVFDEPQRALTPGQAVVLYDGDLVLGSGTITQVPD